MANKEDIQEAERAVVDAALIDSFEDHVPLNRAVARLQELCPRSPLPRRRQLEDAVVGLSWSDVELAGPYWLRWVELHFANTGFAASNSALARELRAFADELERRSK